MKALTTRQKIVCGIVVIISVLLLAVGVFAQAGGELPIWPWWIWWLYWVFINL